MWVGTTVAVVGEARRQRVTELDRARLLVHPHARDMQAVHQPDDAAFEPVARGDQISSRGAALQAGVVSVRACHCKTKSARCHTGPTASAPLFRTLRDIRPVTTRAPTPLLVRVGAPMHRVGAPRQDTGKTGVEDL